MTATAPQPFQFSMLIISLPFLQNWHLGHFFELGFLLLISTALGAIINSTRLLRPILRHHGGRWWKSGCSC